METIPTPAELDEIMKVNLAGNVPLPKIENTIDTLIQTQKIKEILWELYYAENDEDQVKNKLIRKTIFCTQVISQLKRVKKYSFVISVDYATLNEDECLEFCREYLNRYILHVVHQFEYKYEIKILGPKWWRDLWLLGQKLPSDILKVIKTY